MDDCYINVVGFGSSYQKLFKTSEVYNDSTVDKACAHAQSMEADLGGTEILEALADVFSQPLIKGYPRQVFLLTDGEVGNTQQVIDLTRQNADQTRCFALGIGSGASTALIKGVAKAGRGKAEFVISADQMQAKVIKMLKNALQPALLDCKVTWDLPKGCNAQSVPNPLPSVFRGESLVVYGVLDLTMDKDVTPLIGSVTLTATLSTASGGGEQVKHKVSFEGVSWESGENKLLHRLAAKTLIQAKHQPQEYEKKEIISLSKSSNVISKLTSFVAVDKESHKPVSRPMTKPPPDMLGFPVAMCGGSLLPGRKIAGSLKGMRMKKTMKKGKTSPVPCKMTLGSAPPQDEDDERVAFGGDPFVSNPCPPPIPPQENDLLDLVSLQKASGSWQLTEQLARICGVTMDKLKQTCPSELTASNEESVWATALALSCLFGKFKAKKGEWEMVAAKGIKWLKKTIDNKALSYEKIMEMADNSLSN